MENLPPIVFLHGLATSGSRTWGENGWIDLARDSNRTPIIIDLPGHGQSYSDSENATFEQSIKYVESKFPQGEIDAVGFSLGARTLLSLASASPSRFRKLVVAGVGENLFTRDAERGKRIADAIAGISTNDDPESQYFRQLANAPDINQNLVTQLMQSPPVQLTEEMLAAVTCPTLVALGDQDFAGPATRLVNALPNSSYVELRGVDHFATPKDFSFIEATLKFIDAEPQW